MSRINFKRALVITVQLKLYRNINVEIIYNVRALLISITRKQPKTEFDRNMYEFQIAIHLINHQINRVNLHFCGD